MSINFTPNAKALKKDSGWLDFTVIESPAYVASTSTYVTVNDMIYADILAASVLDNAILELANVTLNQDISLQSTDTSKVTVDGLNITRVANGDVDVIVNAYGKPSQRIHRSVGVAPTTIREPSSFVAGTLARHIYDATLATTANITQSNAVQKALDYPTTPDVNVPNVTRLSNSYLDNFDLTGISVLRKQPNQATRQEFPVTLVSPRHAITAKHVTPPVGTIFVFKDRAGQYQTVTVTKKLGLGVPYNPARYDDVVIVEFDKDVTNCNIHSVMPTGWATTYSPSLLLDLNPIVADRVRSALPIIRFAQHYPINTQRDAVLQISPSMYEEYVGNTQGYSVTNIEQSPLLAPYKAWSNKTALGGDSGGPHFLLINGKLVLYSVASTITNGAIVSPFVAEANSFMATHTLTHPNLTTFTGY